MSGTVLYSTKSFSEVGHASELSGDLSANLTAVSDWWVIGDRLQFDFRCKEN